MAWMIQATTEDVSSEHEKNQSKSWAGRTPSKLLQGLNHPKLPSANVGYIAEDRKDRASSEENKGTSGSGGASIKGRQERWIK
jgi:hypothetical protein